MIKPPSHEHSIYYLKYEIFGSQIMGTHCFIRKGIKCAFGKRVCVFQTHVLQFQLSFFFFAHILANFYCSFTVAQQYLTFSREQCTPYTVYGPTNYTFQQLFH